MSKSDYYVAILLFFILIQLVVSYRIAKDNYRIGFLQGNQYGLDKCGK